MAMRRRRDEEGRARREGEGATRRGGCNEEGRVLRGREGAARRGECSADRRAIKGRRAQEEGKSPVIYSNFSFYLTGCFSGQALNPIFGAQDEEFSEFCSTQLHSHLLR